MTKLRLGVVANSRLENERRLPIHPQHIASIDRDVRDQLVLENGYGEPCGFADKQLAPQVAGMLSREELFARCDAVLLFKPLLQDFLDLRAGQILWGCPHFVQREKVTQAAIDNRLTVIAMEAMQHWSADGGHSPSVGPGVGEMAGYCSIQHALTLAGLTGHYGRRIRAVVIGYGSTGLGAVKSLHAQGITDTTILTRRPPASVTTPVDAARKAQLTTDPDGTHYVSTSAGRVWLTTFLAGYDIIVNCVRQNPNAPDVFLTEQDLPALTPGTLIVDVSTDSAMGFSWARATTFAEPMLSLANDIRYYSIDHSPSYLWDSASWVLSESVLPYLRVVVSGEQAWEANETIRRAVEIRCGVIQNPDILSYQGRDSEYPHSQR